MKQGSLKRFFASSVIMFIFWIVVSSSIDVPHLLIGVLAALLIGYFSSDFLIQSEREIRYFKALPHFLFFIALLIIEILKANIQVARLVLDPSLPISPSIVKFKTKLRKDTSKATLANSITLTPGTLTIDIKGDTFYVHTLTKEAAEDVTNWPIEDVLREVEDVT
jgi:multicomponent Na+:H+ antiporter subunit E